MGFINDTIEFHRLKHKARTLHEAAVVLRDHMVNDTLRAWFNGPKELCMEDQFQALDQKLSQLNPTAAEWDLEISIEEPGHFEKLFATVTEELHSLQQSFNRISEGNWISEKRRKDILTHLIERMGKADECKVVDMRGFRTTRGPILFDEPSVMSPKEMQECGTTACFSGHIRLSDFINKNYSLSQEHSAAKIIVANTVLCPAGTVAFLLGVPFWFASLMIYEAGPNMDAHPLYGPHFAAVKGFHVAYVLKQLYNGMSPEAILAEATVRNKTP